MQATGVQIFHDKKGKPIQALIDLNQYGYVIEDLLDIIEIEKRKEETKESAEKVFANIDKKWSSQKKKVTK